MGVQYCNKQRSWPDSWKAAAHLLTCTRMPSVTVSLLVDGRSGVVATISSLRDAASCDIANSAAHMCCAVIGFAANTLADLEALLCNCLLQPDLQLMHRVGILQLLDCISNLRSPAVLLAMYRVQ